MSLVRRRLLAFLICLCLCAVTRAHPPLQTPSDAKARLAQALIAARTDAERASLLEKNRDLLDGELWQGLSNQARKHYSEGAYEQSLSILLIAQRVSEIIGDRLLIARTLNNIGLICRGQGDLYQALHYFEK